MDASSAPVPETDPDRVKAVLDELRRRSRHRLWWSSARVALRRGPAGERDPGPEEDTSSGEEA